MADKEKNTMEPFDWKQKFDVSYTCLDSTDGFDRYHIENETGGGTITACTVFPVFRRSCWICVCAAATMR